MLDLDDRIEDCNRCALDWFFCGTERAQIIGRSAGEVCSCASTLTNIREAADGACHVVNLDGQDVQVVASRILDEAGRHAKTVMLFTDLTRQMENERHLQLYAKVFSLVGEGILITDADNRIIEVNAAVTRITGYEREALIGTTHGILKSGLDESPFSRELSRTLRQTGHWHGEIVDRSRDGRMLPLLQTISEVRDAHGTLTHHISVMTDISSIKETQQRLDFLAHHDALTELPNRLLFSDRLNHAIERAQRDSQALALLFIDLDRPPGARPLRRAVP